MNIFLMLGMSVLGFAPASPSHQAPADLPVLVEAPTALRQTILPSDTLHLFDVRAIAAERDPRSVQPSLLAEASRLRINNLRAQRLPQVSLSAQATHQNEVLAIDFGPSGSVGPPRDQYHVQTEVDWLLYSGGQRRRETETERARLAENIAGVAVTLHALREGATETFFAALLYQAQADALTLSVNDLEARLQLVQAQVQDSVALPADAAILEAELIQLRQQVEEADAGHQAALAVLAALLDTDIAPTTELAVPDLDKTTAEVQLPSAQPSAAGQASIDAPELRYLALRQARLEAEARVATARILPQVSVFGQVGLGKPGPFNFLSEDINEYGLAGVRLHWSVVDWGQARRNARLLQQQAAITVRDGDATARRIVRDIQDERTTIERLTRTLADDLRVVTLREQALQVAQRQLDEGVLLPALYADRLSDLAEARLAQQRHRIERAHAQARLLSALGRFPGEPRADSSTSDLLDR